jgi:acyl dehydratase
MTSHETGTVPDWTGPVRSFPFVVEAGHVLAFVRAIGEDESLGVAPPTFTTVADHFDPEFDRRPPRGAGWGAGLPASHLHVEQHFTYARPLVIGERLVAHRGAGRRWEKQGRSAGRLLFVEERTELVDATGETIVVMRWVDVHTERPHVVLTNEQGARPKPAAPASVDAAITPAVDTVPAADPMVLADGKALVDEVVLVDGISRTQFVMYAGASGDFHPLHHDEELAQRNGYPSVFAPGMLTMALTGRAVTDLVGHDALRSFGGRFRAQVWPGDTLTATRTRTSGATDPTLTARIDVVTRNQHGVTVFEGTVLRSTDRAR